MAGGEDQGEEFGEIPLAVTPRMFADFRREVLDTFGLAVAALRSEFATPAPPGGPSPDSGRRECPREESIPADLLAKYGPRAGGTVSELFRPSIEEGELMEVDQRALWMDPFITFLSSGKFPEGDMDKRRFRYKSAYYSLHAGSLYRKTLSGLLARCVSEEEVPRILEEIHSGECGSHSGGRTLEGRVLRQGYFWPTLSKDAAEFTKKYSKCQLYAPLQLLPAQRLRTITAPWPFAIWGLDLVGPFPPASGQRKFLLVMIDYFSKWHG